MSLSFKEYLDFIEIPYSEIASATNNFSDPNLIPQGSEEYSCVKVYKGQLSLSGQSIDIVARKFQQADKVLKELHIACALHQRNISSVVAYIGNNDDFIVVKKLEANGSLDKHLSGSTLTWLQRLQICVGIAHALSCLHYNDVFKDNTYIIHGAINSSNVLLDENWEPKLQGSELSMIAKRNHLQHTSKHTTMLQYMDPAYETTGGLTDKSDVFSFGVVLFEVLFGRKASIHNNDNWSFARLSRLHYDEGTLDEIIDSNLRKQMDLQSLDIFSETAYFCLKTERQQRPEMDKVVKRLEQALEFQKKHESHEQAIVVEDTSCTHLRVKGKQLDNLRIPLSDIILATDNFSKPIGSGGYGVVYKAKLNFFDGKYSSSTKGKYKSKMSTTHRTVAIKRIFSREDTLGEQGFLSEIEMLSKCKHQNVISLLGFCDEGPEMILVYEYASKGSLANCFENDFNIINLTWAQRIQICLHIAHGLKYLHTRTADKKQIIHRDIKSANILLDDNLVAKIADFGLSKLEDVNKRSSTLITSTIAGTEIYWDPEYRKSGKLKKASDIYSLGVVMFEIFCGRLAYDNIYNEKPLSSMVRECFNKGTLKEMVDPKVKEANESSIMLNRRLHQDSLDTFSIIAYQCLAETQDERPTIEVIINELETAFDLHSKSNLKDSLQISLEDIKLATENFNYCITEGRFWKQYEGKLRARTPIIAKRWNNESSQGHYQLFRESEILLRCKHKNIIGLLGYCKRNDENIIIYEHLLNGRLDEHLANNGLTWMSRLKICIDIACGLEFLHAGGVKNELSMIHRDIKSSNILLDGDWKAKLSNLELSSKAWAYEEILHINDNAYNSLCYVDPNYKEWGSLRTESDIYSLGVVFMEILCGRLASVDGCEDLSQSLGPLAKRHYAQGTLDELVFKGIRDQIAPQSLTTFRRIALQCLEEDRKHRPNAKNVVENLKIALEFQEDLEIWEPKLPRDYEKIFEIKEHPEYYSDKTKKDLYNMLTKGILLQEGKVCFSLGANGERNEMISAKFLFKNRRSHNWEFIPISRFQKVAMMLDLSKLKTQIKIRTQYLSLGVSYGAYLIFKFRNSRKVSTTPVYVNLKYKIGNETLHSYFATWRDDEWMMTELSRFWTHKKEVDFKVQLESFSRYYCKSGAIYVEGIEFRENNNVKHEQIEEANIVQQESHMESKGTPKRSQTHDVNIVPQQSHMESKGTPKRSQTHDQNEKLFSLSEVNKKQHHSFSTKKALYNNEGTPERSHSYVEGEKLFSLSKVIKKKHNVLILSTKKAPYHKTKGTSKRSQTYNEGEELFSLSKEIKTKRSKQTPNRSQSYDEGEKLFHLSKVSDMKTHIPSTKKALYHSKGTLKRSQSYDEGEKVLSLSNVIKKKLQHVVSAKKALYLTKGSVPKRSQTYDDGEKLFSQRKVSKKKHSKEIPKRSQSYNEEKKPFIVSKVNEKKHHLLSVKTTLYNTKRKLKRSQSYDMGEKVFSLGKMNEKKHHILFAEKDLYDSKGTSQRSQSYDEGEELFPVSNVSEKKHHFVSAKKALYNSSDVRIYASKPSDDSRFKMVIEVLRHQLLHIKCKIKSRMLSSDTQYKCYLVFKLSEACHGLHCPVIVKDLLQWNNKETQILYFRSPSLLNRHNFNRIPKRRGDGWAEVCVWEGNSDGKFQSGFLPINLNLISYEGNMSGLIVYGIEFRPM